MGVGVEQGESGSDRGLWPDSEGWVMLSCVMEKEKRTSGKGEQHQQREQKEPKG